MPLDADLKLESVVRSHCLLTLPSFHGRASTLIFGVTRRNESKAIKLQHWPTRAIFDRAFCACSSPHPLEPFEDARA